MPTYEVRNKEQPAVRCTDAQSAANALAEGGSIMRKWRSHWYIQLDRSYMGGGFTCVRVGYGGIIEEPLADAKARFLRNEPFFANEGTA